MSIIEKCTHIVDSVNNTISNLLWGSAGFQVSLYTTPCGNPGCSNRIPLAVRKAKPRGTRCNCKNDAKRAGSGAGWRRKFGKFRGLKLCRVKNSLIDISSSSLSNLSNRLSKLKEVCSETKNGSRAEVEEILDEDSSKSDEIRVEDSPVNLVSDYVQTCTEESIEYPEKPKSKKQVIPLKYLKVINTGTIKKSFTKKKNCCKAGAERLKLGLSDSVIPLKLASRELLAKASDSFTSVRNKIKIPKKKEIFEHPPGYKIPNKFSFKSSLGTQSRDYNKSKVSFECSAPRDRTADAEGSPAVETRSRGTCASFASSGSSSNLASFSNLLKTVGTVAKRIASSLSTSDFDSTLSCLSHLSNDLRNRLLKFECVETGRRTPGFFNVPKISIDKLTSRLNTNAFPGHFAREGKSAKENNVSSEEDKATSESSSSEEFTVESKREKFKDIQKISTSSEGSSSERDTDEEAIKTVNEKCSGKACKWTCLACTVKDANTNTSLVQNSNISYKAGQRHQSEQKSKEKNKKIQIPSTNCEVESLFMSPVLIKKSYNAKLPNGFQTNLKPDHTQTLLPNKERERMEAKKMPKGSKVFVERQAKNFHANHVTKQLRADNKSRTYDASFDEDPTTDVESLCLRVEVSEESQRCPVGSMLRTAEEKIKAADAKKSSEDIVADLTKSIMEANANESSSSVYSNKSSEEKDSKEITLEEVKPIEEAKLRRRISWNKYKEPPINPAAETNPKMKKTRMARFFDRILRYDKTSAGSRWKPRTLKNENDLQPGDGTKAKKKQVFGNKKSSIVEQKPAVNKKQGHINLPHDTNEKNAVETTAGPKAHSSISTFDSEDLRSDEMFRGRRIMDSVEKMMLQVGKKKQNGGFLAVVRKPSQRYLPMAQTRTTAQKNYSVPKIGSHLFRRSAVSVEKKKGRVKPEKLLNKRQDSLIRRISTVLFNNSKHSTTSDENDNDNPKIDDDKPTTDPERQLSSALKKDSSSERKRSVNFAVINDGEHDTDERSKHYPNQPNNHDIDKKNTIEFNGPVHHLITPKHSMAVLKSTKDDDRNLTKETIANEKVPDSLIKNVNDAKSEVTERSPQNISDASDATTSSTSTAPSEPTVARKKSLIERLSTLFRRHSSTDSVPTENEDAKTEKKYKKTDDKTNESEKKKPSQKEHAKPLIDKSSSNSFTRKTISRTQEFKASSRKLSVDRKISSTLYRQRLNKIEMQKSSTKDTLKSINSKTPVVEPLINLKKSSSFDIEENPETEENEDIIPIKKVSRSVFKNSSDSSFNLIDNEEKESVKSIPTSILKRLSSFLVFKRSSSSSDIKENKISTLSIRKRHSKPSTSSADDRRVTKNGKKLAPGKKISKNLFRRAKVKSREVSTVSSQQPKDKLESVDLAESLIDAHWDMIQRRLGLMRKVMMVDKTTNVCPRSRLRGSIAGLLKESSDDKITIPRTSIYEENSTITETDEEDDESCPPLMLGSDVEQLSKRVDVQYAKMPYFQNTHQTQASKRKKLKGKVENLRCNSSKACNRAQLSQNSYNIKYVTPFENSANETRIHDRCDKRKTSITDKYDTRDTESKEKNNILRALSKFDDIFCPNCPKNDLRTLVQKFSKSKIDALIHYTKTNNASADTQANPRGGLMPYDASKPHTRRTPTLNEETHSVEDIKATIVHRLASLIQHYHGVRTTRACQTPGRKDADRTKLSIRRRCNPGNSRIPKRDSSVISQESSYSSPTFSDASIL